MNNACATQALLSILMNRPEVELGEVLDNFKQFTAEFNPEMKGTFGKRERERERETNRRGERERERERRDRGRDRERNRERER